MTASIPSDDDEPGGANNSGVGLNTTLAPDPEMASDELAAGPELGDANAAGSAVMPVGDRRGVTADPDAQTDVSTDPHRRQPILAKPAKEQP